MNTTSEYQQAIEQYGGHFSPSEFAIRPETGVTDIQPDFFTNFLQWRLWAKLPMLITSAYRPGDPRAHGKGLALDVIIFEEWKKTVADPLHQWLLGTTWPFKGVGIYFDWTWGAEEHPAVGLHVDDYQEGRPLRWLRIEKQVSGKPQSLYYYQDVQSGRFYNKKLKEYLELDNVIKRFWK